MPAKTIAYKDMTVVASVGVFGGQPKFVVSCRGFQRSMTQDEFAAFIYPVVDQAATAIECSGSKTDAGR